MGSDKEKRFYLMVISGCDECELCTVCEWCLVGMDGGFPPNCPLPKRGERGLGIPETEYRDKGGE
jgi:hypothetical protein